LHHYHQSAAALVAQPIQWRGLANAKLYFLGKWRSIRSHKPEQRFQKVGVSWN